MIEPHPEPVAYLLYPVCCGTALALAVGRAGMCLAALYWHHPDKRRVYWQWSAN